MSSCLSSCETSGPGVQWLPHPVTTSLILAASGYAGWGRLPSVHGNIRLSCLSPLLARCWIGWVCMGDRPLTSRHPLTLSANTGLDWYRNLPYTLLWGSTLLSVRCSAVALREPTWRRKAGSRHGRYPRTTRGTRPEGTSGRQVEYGPGACNDHGSRRRVRAWRVRLSARVQGQRLPPPLRPGTPPNQPIRAIVPARRGEGTLPRVMPTLGEGACADAPVKPVKPLERCTPRVTVTLLRVTPVRRTLGGDSHADQPASRIL